MQATRDFYEKPATELAVLAERSKSQDKRSDLLDLARAWRDLACVWAAPVGPSSGVRSFGDKHPAAQAVHHAGRR